MEVLYLCTYIRISSNTYCQILFIDYSPHSVYKKFMKNKKPFTTSLDIPLLKEIKKLSIDLDRPVNDLLEEAMKWLLEKYKKRDK